MESFLFPFFLRIVTLEKRMEFRGKVVGEVGVDAVKMERVCLRDGSENDGVAVGLEGEGGRVGEVSRVSNGGKSANEEREGTGATKEEETMDNDEIGEEILNYYVGNLELKMFRNRVYLNLDLVSQETKIPRIGGEIFSS